MKDQTGERPYFAVKPPSLIKSVPHVGRHEIGGMRVVSDPLLAIGMPYAARVRGLDSRKPYEV
jgi:hypothetical protein